MIEVTSGQIASGKLLTSQVFHEKHWYCIPDYQRPYVWDKDQVLNLLNDIWYAANFMKNTQYFLGSYVVHAKDLIKDDINYTQLDLLDGQQRITSLFLMMAVIRDITPDTNKTRKDTCRKVVLQEANRDDKIPQQVRLVFDIRDNVTEFIETYVTPDGGTAAIEKLKVFAEKSDDKSIKNMSQAILTMRDFLTNPTDFDIDIFFPYLRQNVMLVYVASRDLEDSFRMFTVLNDRGMKLGNSDIIKAQNLKEVNDADKRKKFATAWEEIENELGDGFDTFLGYIRSILVKEKARQTLLKEFEENIYHPKTFDASTKTYTLTTPLLTKGTQTFKLIFEYKNTYDSLFDETISEETGSYEFDNLLRIMRESLPADFWIIPLIYYKKIFGSAFIFNFLKKLDNKFSADWIVGKDINFRIDSMNRILKALDTHMHSNALPNNETKLSRFFQDECFNFEKSNFIELITTNRIYGKKYSKYILRKLDFLYGNNSDKRILSNDVSIEHILPQNPADNSQWLQDFSPEFREEWTDKLGNLVLISRRKNTSQGRLDYVLKNEKYFKNNIDTLPNSLRVLKSNVIWGVAELNANHSEVAKKLNDWYQV